jgi:hypothetical protein
VPFFGFP